MKSTLVSLFMLVSLLGCNTEMADLGRLTNRPPMIVQLGLHTKLPGFSNSSTDGCAEVVVDKFENLICVGTTTSSMGRTSDGSQDAYAAKFDRNGKLLWVVQLQSTDLGNENGQSVGVDSENNIYIGGVTDRLIGTGAILNKTFVNPSYVWIERLTTAIDNDGFVAKISPNGQIRWIKQFGSVGGNEGCNNIAVSPSGNSYCGSSTNGELGTDAITGTDEYLSSTAINPLVVKIDKNSNIRWIRQFGVLSQPGKWQDEDKCSGITLDDEENVYCGGYTRASLVETNGSVAVPPAQNGQDVMVWVLDKNGFTTKILQVGITSDSNPAIVNVNGNETCDDIAVDKNKNIYCMVGVIGNFGESSGGAQDFTIMKWNSSGQIEWASQLGSDTVIPGYDSSHYEQGVAITLDNKDNIIVGGYTDGPSVASLNGLSDILLANFNPNGELNWIKQFGSAGSENCGGVTTDTSGNVYCSGITTGNFGETTGGSADAFILRVDPLGNL